MTYGNATQDYQGRQDVGVNIGEEIFEQWCARNGWNCTRLGFDEKFANVGAFYNLNPVLRNMPDYVIQRDEKTFAVNVKGTPNIKEKERLMLICFDCPTKRSMLSVNKAMALRWFCTYTHLTQSPCM